MRPWPGLRRGTVHASASIDGGDTGIAAKTTTDAENSERRKGERQPRVTRRLAASTQGAVRALACPGALASNPVCPSSTVLDRCCLVLCSATRLQLNLEAITPFVVKGREKRRSLKNVQKPLNTVVLAEQARALGTVKLPGVSLGRVVLATRGQQTRRFSSDAKPGTDGWRRRIVRGRGRPTRR